LIDDASALADQPFTHAVERLQVELIGSLRRHELHRRPLHSFGNGLSVAEVVLLALWNRGARTSPASAAHRATAR